MIVRFAWLSCAVALAAVGPLENFARADVSPVPAQTLDFEVLRNGSPMGRHVVTFTPEGSDLRVSVDVDLKVKVGPLTAFRYEHENNELWRDGRLIGLSSRTLKDGDWMSLTAKVEGQALDIEGAKFDGEAPVGILPTSWWNPDILKAEQALNTETGEILPVSVEEIGAETVMVDGAPVPAKRYRLTSSLVMDLWYDDAGRWVKCAFEARGQKIEYVLSAAS